MHKRGFTLIELLIIVTAVMIVIGLVLPQCQWYVQTKTVPQSFRIRAGTLPISMGR